MSKIKVSVILFFGFILAKYTLLIFYNIFFEKLRFMNFLFEKDLFVLFLFFSLIGYFENYRFLSFLFIYFFSLLNYYLGFNYYLYSENSLIDEGGNKVSAFISMNGMDYLYIFVFGFILIYVVVYLKNI